ncbi:MAG: MarR family transcriptional regulator [Acetobacterium sp.]|nr:MarR family transcriptional regulator [Acetobacterium sp.]
MKKEKKTKKADLKEVKETKKETKKKSAAEEKKGGSVSKKEKSIIAHPVSPDATIDHTTLKKVMIDSALLYHNILVLPQTFAINEESYSLYPSELKALAMIGHFSGINLTQLANKLGISKSAISKCTSKLLEKELIGKEKSLVNVREVVFTLTPNGQIIFNQLETVHIERFEPFNKTLDGFTSDEINDLHRIFLTIQSSLTEIMNNF